MYYIFCDYVMGWEAAPVTTLINAIFAQTTIMG